MANKGKKAYEEYLNEMFSIEETLEKTEHCWAGNDKTKNQKKHAKNLAQKGMYGTVLRRYDETAFNVGYNDWRLQN